ncbi:MAG: patatin-like phospholipase family protein [Hyphomicrobiaceae bacterium]|nr:patatin-like phospholipase family protein [Hyphomicrobiaceae bacterium]
MARGRGLIALPLALALGACAASLRPDGSEIATSSTFGAIPLFNAQQKPMVPPPGATIAGHHVPAAAHTTELAVLAISGGGSDGAFGAGVLKGWTESGKRPVFNIVTGVSTGALIATFAFLGPDWDGEIERFYTKVTAAQIYVEKGIFGVFEESLYDTAPFRSMVEKVVTPRLLDAVAAEHARGRRLYVATTDLDSGTVVVWDMGGIAASNVPERLETYRDVLVASAAFPGFFKPVYVRHSDEAGKPRMHVDGGVKAPVLLRSFMVEGPQRKKTVYMLVNGKLSLKAGVTEPVQATVLGISRRSIAELMRGLTYKTIYQAYVTTRQARAQFGIMYVPDDAQDIDDALRFRPKEMQRLFEVGRTYGRDPSRWLKEPPRLEPLERIEVKAAR